MRLIGFSTGALAKSDFNLALVELKQESVNCIELSALRFPELDPLLKSILHSCSKRLDMTRNCRDTNIAGVCLRLRVTLACDFPCEN